MAQIEGSGIPSPPQAQNGRPKRLHAAANAMPKHPSEVLVSAGNLSAK